MKRKLHGLRSAWNTGNYRKGCFVLLPRGYSSILLSHPSYSDRNMRTYETALVDVDANVLYGALFKTQTFRDDDIIIMYVVWNLIMKSSSQHELP